MRFRSGELVAISDLLVSYLILPLRLVDTYSSYFGYLTTVTWSPDGRFILVGGGEEFLAIGMHF
jgi:hypothetical protein